MIQNLSIEGEQEKEVLIELEFNSTCRIEKELKRSMSVKNV